MSGITLGVHRVATALVMSVVLGGSMLASAQVVRADEELIGAPAPVEPRPTTEVVQPQAPATATSASVTTAPTSDVQGADAVPLQTAQAPRRPATPPARRKFEHWELAPTVQFTFSTGSDIVPGGGPQGGISKLTGNTLPLDIVRLVGDARYRFNNRYALTFTRIAHTGATGRILAPTKANPNGATFGGHSEDYEERFLLADQMDPYFTARAGYAMRTRTCCPAAAQNGRTPRIHTGFFSDINWRFGPNTIGGKPWTTSFRWEEYKHNTVVPRPAADQGTKPTFSFTAYSNFFVWHQTKFVPYYGIEYFSTYFSYSNAPTETYRKVYGVQYRATRDVSWRTYVKNDQSGGALNATGNSAHKSTLFLEGTYRLHW